MNWGKGIIGGMIIFMLFILGMCFYMFTMPGDDYDHKYYEKGLNFDQDYNKKAQVFKDKAQPVIKVDSCCIQVTFPQTITGQVRLLRPSGEVKDQVFNLDNKNGLPIEILTTHIAKGQWQLVFNWTSNNKAYLYQQEVYIK